MARCNCSGPTSCGCALTVADCLTVTGSGTGASPWEVGLDLDSAGAITCGVGGLGLSLGAAPALEIVSNGLQVARDSWVGGTQLARAIRTTNDTNKGAVADLTSMSITFTLIETRWVLFLASVYFVQNAANGTPQLYLTDSLNNIVKQGVAVVAAGTPVTLDIIASIQLAAGTYTYKLRATTTAGTITPVANANELMFMAAYEMGA